MCETLTHIQPIPLDDVTLRNFTDPAVSARALQSLSTTATSNDDSHEVNSEIDQRLMYPLLIWGITFYAESSANRIEWKNKIEEVIELRKRLRESDRFIKIEPLTSDASDFLAAQPSPAGTSQEQETSFTSNIACSVPLRE